MLDAPGEKVRCKQRARCGARGALASRRRALRSRTRLSGVLIASPIARVSPQVPHPAVRSLRGQPARRVHIMSAADHHPAHPHIIQRTALYGPGHSGYYARVARARRQIALTLSLLKEAAVGHAACTCAQTGRGGTHAMHTRPHPTIARVRPELDDGSNFKQITCPANWLHLPIPHCGSQFR
jgi:hypothetical protein